MNDGGPAFPGVVGQEGRGNFTQQVLPDGQSVFVEHAPGMSLRDYFAAKAMAAFIAGGQGCPSMQGTRMPIAEAAYFVADGMIVERAKPFRASKA